VSDFAIVTGGSRGIGHAIVRALLDAGYRVGFLARSKDSVEAAQASFELVAPSRTLGVACDLADPSRVSSAYAELHAWGGDPYALVNNAGINSLARFSDMSASTFEKIVDINLHGPARLTRLALPFMLAKKRGRIVNVSSISGTLGSARMTAYSASKWALIGFTKSLAAELVGTGVVALSVAPGSVDTEMLRGTGFPPAVEASEVADLVVYACSDRGRALAGSNLEIFG
jgi:3-oxoacyl-[acyl-carrier protein] reductase